MAGGRGEDREALRGQGGQVPPGGLSGDPGGYFGRGGRENPGEACGRLSDAGSHRLLAEKGGLFPAGGSGPGGGAEGHASRRRGGAGHRPWQPGHDAGRGGPADVGKRPHHPAPPRRHAQAVRGLPARFPWAFWEPPAWSPPRRCAALSKRWSRIL